MVLTKVNENDFYENEMEVKIVLEGEFNSFKDFGEVFDFFSKFDNTYYDFKSGRENVPFYRERQQKTQVVSVSSGSLEILVFIEKHWFELLLFFLSVNFKDIEKNIRTNVELFDDSIDRTVEYLKEITSDFPDLEREEIIRIIGLLEKQFENLTIDGKIHYWNQIKRARNVLKKIRRIVRR